MYDDCVVRYRDSRSYYSWICDSGASRFVAQGRVYADRVTYGGSVASQLVWSGPRDVLSAEIGDIVQRHLDVNTPCRVYFHVAALGTGAVQWNRMTENMQRWWRNLTENEFSAIRPRRIGPTLSCSGLTQ